MRRDEVLHRLAARRAELTRFGVKSLALFGSVARDEAKADSDIDLLVEFTGPATFKNYMGLTLFLEQLLGQRVDLVVKHSLRPRLRASVEQDLINVA